MKLVQAREWADIYLSSPHLSQEAYSLEDMLIDAYTAGWREGWEDGELCGYNRGFKAAKEIDAERVAHMEDKVRELESDLKYWQDKVINEEYDKTLTGDRAV